MYTFVQKATKVQVGYDDKPEQLIEGVVDLAIFIKDDDTGEERLVACFDDEDVLDHLLGLLLNESNYRREALWEKCE